MEPVTTNTIRAGHVAGMVNYLLARTETAPVVTPAEMHHAIHVAVRQHANVRGIKAKGSPPPHKPVMGGGDKGPPSPSPWTGGAEGPTPDQLNAGKPRLQWLYGQLVKVQKAYRPSGPKDVIPKFLADLVSGVKEVADDPMSTAGHNNVVTAIGNLTAELQASKKTKTQAALTLALAYGDEARKMFPSKEEFRQAKAKGEELHKVAPIIIDTDLVALVKLVPTARPVHEPIQNVLEAERAYAKEAGNVKGQDPTKLGVLAKLLQDTAASVSLFVDKLDVDDPDHMTAQAITEEVVDILSPLTPSPIWMPEEVARWANERRNVRGVEIAVLQTVGKVDRKSAVYRRAVEVALALRALSRDPFSKDRKGDVHSTAAALESILDALPDESPDRILGAKIAKAAHDAAGPTH